MINVWQRICNGKNYFDIDQLASYTIIVITIISTMCQINAYKQTDLTFKLDVSIQQFIYPCDKHQPFLYYSIKN